MTTDNPSIQRIAPHGESGFGPADVLKEAQTNDEIYVETQFYDREGIPCVSGTVSNTTSTEKDDGRMVEKTVHIKGEDGEQLELTVKYDTKSAYTLVLEDTLFKGSDEDQSNVFKLDDLATCELECQMDGGRAAAAEPIIDTITDQLEHVAAQGFTLGQVFRDWVDLMLASLQGDEETYEKTVERYVEQSRFETTDDRHPVAQLSNAMGELLAAREVPYYDVLGEVYMEIGQRSDELGQHFTPHSVSDMMAASTVGDGDDLEANSSASENPPFPGLSGVSIADPACGSGRLLLGMGAAVEDRVSDQDFWVYGKDLDSVCAKMTVLNLFLHGVDGVVVQGNSLNVTTHSAWVVRNDNPVPIQSVTGNCSEEE